MHQAMNGLGGLDVIISNAVGPAVRIFKPCDREVYEYCNTMASSDVQRAGQDLPNSGILTLLVNSSGTRYFKQISLCRLPLTHIPVLGGQLQS